MTVFTYSAKRGMQATGQAIIADANIAASLAGSPQVSTFVTSNSPATDLSVFTDGYWLKSSGWTDSNNNEWFLIDGVPTVNLVTLDPLINNVVTEAAGNDITLTEYYRGVGQSYSIESSVRLGNVMQDVGYRNEAVSISGKKETLFQRRLTTYDLQVGVIDGADFPQWREFLASVMGGETFTFDAYGTIASPDDPVLARLAGDPTYTRIDNLEKYLIAFKVELA